MGEERLREALLQRPAQPPPAGIIPDFEHPPNIQDTARAILIVCVLLATFMMIMKMYTQICIVRKMQLEDYFLLIAWATFAFGFAPAGFLISNLPVGIHQWNTRIGPLINHLFYWYCGLIIYAIIMLSLKLAVLFQIIRVFVPSGFRDFTFRAAHTMIWGNVIFYIAFAFLEAFCCTPRQKFWDKTIAEGHCMDFLVIHVAGAVICLVSDILILLLPQRVIHSLHLPLKKRIGLSLLFTVGVFASTSSGVRLYYHIHLVRTRSDLTYSLGRIAIWGTGQILSGFLVACLPVVPRVIAHLRETSWYDRLDNKLTSISKASFYRSGHSNVGVTTIGGSGGQILEPNRRRVSDIEFHDLVIRTQPASVINTIVELKTEVV